ncbi:hypothetical protein MGN01_45530 [Methylobacterium gnaphalii]|uniref:Uncharacterized protein n=1 Tax=Methylobacterium gnaphalii TaxID=1010610 RepID=A0A512JRX5_9HYPH|nr:hypothetical protein MGN01_45530 [Methylobacterium gnaphalii]
MGIDALLEIKGFTQPVDGLLDATNPFRRNMPIGLADVKGAPVEGHNGGDHGFHVSIVVDCHATYT